MFYQDEISMASYLDKPTKFYAGVGHFRVAVSKYNLMVRKIIVSWGDKEWSYYRHILDRSELTEFGVHKPCGQHVKFLDGMLYCEKCDKLVEIENAGTV